MSRFTILAVDDETSVLEILFQTFRADYTVLRTENPHEALDMLREQPVDLLITDLGVFRFDDSGMVLERLLPGATLEDIAANTTATYRVANL